MSTFWNMYKAEKKICWGVALFIFEREKKLQIPKCVFEIEKTIMQNNLDIIYNNDDTLLKEK